MRDLSEHALQITLYAVGVQHQGDVPRLVAQDGRLMVYTTRRRAERAVRSTADGKPTDLCVVEFTPCPA